MQQSLGPRVAHFDYIVCNYDNPSTEHKLIKYSLIELNTPYTVRRVGYREWK